MIDILMLPALLCVALVFIHVLFGSYVLKRGILFIDLALAQWAALGYVVAESFHIENNLYLFLSGFLATVCASILLSLLSPLFKETNLQEAVIGLVYITGMTLTTTFLAVNGMEGHHLKDILSGHLLFINNTDIWVSGLIYTAIALILAKFHTYFSNSQTRFWNFLFYALFGAVVTSSVKLVGVLLVFSYLVIPILCTVNYKLSLQKQLLLAWTIGISASITGLLMSLWADIPPSYAIIFSLNAFFVFSVLLIKLRRN